MSLQESEESLTDTGSAAEVASWAGAGPLLPAVSFRLPSAEQALALRLVCKAWRDGLSTRQATARLLKLFPSRPEANADAFAFAAANGAGADLEVQLHHTYVPPASKAQLEQLFSIIQDNATQVIAQSSPGSRGERERELAARQHQTRSAWQRAKPMAPVDSCCCDFCSARETCASHVSP